MNIKYDLKSNVPFCFTLWSLWTHVARFLAVLFHIVVSGTIFGPTRAIRVFVYTATATYHKNDDEVDISLRKPQQAVHRFTQF